MTRKELEKLAEKSAKERKLRKEKTLEEVLAEVAALDKARTIRRHENKLTKEEKALKKLNAMLEYKPDSIPEEKVKVKKKNPNAWDVKIGDPIEYFDPTLSYELTGYRPINETEGLDFDPKLFTVAADNYRKNGKYTSLLPGTFAHRAYWKEEFMKCRNGVTIGKYTLTGENYFFINYYRLLSVLIKDAEEVRMEDFPAFFAKLYEYFHYISLARKLGKDVNAFKSRGIGFSEITASNLACAYTFHKASYNILTAFDLKYVDQTLMKVWQELDFLNTCTDGAFKHLRMRIDTSIKKKASIVDKDNNESGWGSVIEGIVHDKPRKLRGARVYNLVFEEAGSDPQLLDTYIQSRPLVDILGFRVGQRSSGGTGGDAGPSLSGLKTIFYNPEGYQVLPYKNTYARDGQVALTGFFIPAFSLWFGKFDSRGVVDEKAAREYYEKEWAKITDPAQLLREKAEYCFTPEDAFVLEGSNVFNTEKLTEQLVNIEQLKVVEPPKKIRLSWDYSKELAAVDKNSMPKAEFKETGDILITELPMTDDKGVPFNNLYLVGIDAIDQDASTSTGQTDVSKFCIVVLRRLVGLKPPKIVALYLDRPNDIRDAYNNAIKLCLFYNAKALVEATKIGVITHFQNNGKSSYLMRRPSATLTASKLNKRQYGVPAVLAIIEHQIELILEYVEDFYDQIDYLEVIDQLIRYSYENKRKFDIVAAFGLALLANEEMLGKIPKLDNTGDRKLENIGYYINEYGLKVFGVIKNVQQTTMRYGWFRETN